MTSILISDPLNCGLGESHKCCVYLITGENGFECGRVIPAIKAVIDDQLSEGAMTAAYIPVADYPNCQTNRLESVKQ